MEIMFANHAFFVSDVVAEEILNEVAEAEREFGVEEADRKMHALCADAVQYEFDNCLSEATEDLEAKIGELRGK